MKYNKKILVETDVKYLQVDAGPRFWEDARIDGIEDTSGKLIPCRKKDCWCPKIDLDTGQIVNWEKGVTAYIHYKVCDAGKYTLLDKDNEVIVSTPDYCYVPDFLSPKEEGWGDYMIMEIDENGFIQGFNVCQDDLDELFTKK